LFSIYIKRKFPSREISFKGKLIGADRMTSKLQRKQNCRSPIRTIHQMVETFEWGIGVKYFKIKKSD